ncbi:hypothetical protein GCM10028805_17090 [Spirosoma harenae]
MRYMIAACPSAIITMPILTLGQPTSQTLNASGTYVVSAGYTSVVKVEAWGGGGGAYASINKLILVASSCLITRVLTKHFS